ncbi:DUF6504 family protein [Nocardioides KLBMP 9356]|uniref:DUF6504 family protein n=1 Tax=Nocardioides potassii TaxID=2911371 RepID=A0ABS9H7W8_9ACTN|nr:DUF6504 family protein [Nocardioides potassii]MCF6377317.1 DUF6504 family protein [Nocardioides potassii]
MRQYDDPVEVRRGEAEDPDQFLWRGRLWKVRAVVAHWVEAGAWRPAASTSEPGGTGTAEREMWRVEAGRGLRVADADTDGHSGGHSASHGVFDLSLDWADGRWQLVGSQD